MSLIGHRRRVASLMPASNATSSQAIGFGTGGLLRIAGRRHRQEVLAAALDSGITHFDTAPIYGFGESERELGRFLRGPSRRNHSGDKIRPSTYGLASRLAIVQGLARQIVRTFPPRAARQSATRLSLPHRRVLRSRRSKQAWIAACGRCEPDYLDFYLAHQGLDRRAP